MPVTVGGKLQVIVNATNFIRSYDVQNGDVIWQCSGQTRNVIPTPVVGFGMVYCTSGFRGSALQAIELGRTGDLSGTDAVKWQKKEATPYVPSPLLYDGRIYVCSVNQEVVSCYDAKTGDKIYGGKLGPRSYYYASPVAADGKIYFCSRNGAVIVVEAGDKFKILAQNKIGDRIYATAALVDGKVYLRSDKYMYAFVNAGN